jgi:uncharacterized protein YqeY
MLSLVRKSAAQSKAASEEFRRNGREDLAGKEEGQVRVLEEYAGGVEVVGEGEIRDAVLNVVNALKADKGEGKVVMGDVIKKIFGDGVFGEKNVERVEVARVVKEVLVGEGKSA